MTVHDFINKFSKAYASSRPMFREEEAYSLEMYFHVLILILVSFEESMQYNAWGKFRKCLYSCWQLRIYLNDNSVQVYSLCEDGSVDTRDSWCIEEVLCDRFFNIEVVLSEKEHDGRATLYFYFVEEMMCDYVSSMPSSA